MSYVCKLVNYIKILLSRINKLFVLIFFRFIRREKPTCTRKSSCHSVSPHSPSDKLLFPLLVSGKVASPPTLDNIRCDYAYIIIYLVNKIIVK